MDGVQDGKEVHRSAEDKDVVCTRQELHVFVSCALAKIAGHNALHGSARKPA